ncbi:MAG: transglycosylase domain-containing protein [Chloroflexota bacterium]
MSKSSGYQLEFLGKYQDDPKSKKQQKQQKEPPKKPHGCVRILLFLVQLGLLGLLLGLVLFIGGYVYLSNELADAINQVSTFRGTGVGGTPRFYDRNGNLLFELTTTEKRRWIPYSEIPKVIINATVAAEDDTFWTNLGFDPTAIVAAVISNYRQQDGRPVGASTITQQLVRHIAFSYEDRVAVSYDRKLREIFLSYIMTQQRSKEEIIQMYLNEIYYGNLAYGIEAASQIYFGKSALELELHEAAFLAGLPQSPILWDPYTNFEGAKERQGLILDLMVDESVVSYVDAEVAKNLPLVLRPRISLEEEAASKVLEAPHFVLYVQDELERRYGPDALVRGGWQVTTSLDLNMHKMAETYAREQVAERQAAHDVSNASVVILKPGTGEILAMVGSLDYFDEAIDGQVNVALQPRQPGSSIKPITYATALQKGWTTADVLWDVPIVIDLGGGELMQPRNYDGRFHGPILFRDALANSYNIPPIQLMRDVGISSFIQTARTMGIESLQEPSGYYGLALTLGGGEVPLLEMSHAYATLANGGQKPRLTSILKITDSRGNVLYDAQEERVPAVNALDARIAYIITDILDDDKARIPAMGYNNALDLPFPAAAKTGTTNDYRDNWTMGYTPGVVVGIWMGNSDGHPMVDSSGLMGAAPLWARIMTSIYGDQAMLNSLMVNGSPPPTEFVMPGGIEEKQVCLPQGTGGTGCTASRTDLFMVGTPLHGIPRVGYAPDMTTNPGAWTLVAQGLSATAAQQVARPELADGTQAPLPTLCVINAVRPAENGAARLFLPIPPHYPDEVRARLWARGTGYQMAPATVCPASSVQSSSSGGSSGSSGSSSSGGYSPPAASGGGGSSYRITSPSSGQQVNGTVAIMGTAQFDTAQVQYYKLEIGNGRSPSAWTTFGTTHSQPVNGGVLEQLQADALAPGDYIIRLVLVGQDGNFIGEPYYVPIRVGG